MIVNGLAGFKGRRILLLQGPLGPFFRRLARDLTAAGAEVSKIDFNGGDWLFSQVGAIAFRGTRAAWPVFFEQVLDERQIDMVLLFGDCRPLHSAAHDIVVARGIDLGVFEEGYVRPDYITLERFGVNGHSRISRSPVFYLNTPKIEVAATVNVGNTFWYAAMWAMLYYQASVLLRPWFRHYQHHRPLTMGECLPWLRGTWRKHYFARKEKGVQAALSSTLSGQYFLVALQVHNDAQLHVHSGFGSVPTFIETVVSSFARFGPVGTDLVIKQHPLERGYHDYSQLVSELAQALGIPNRVRYIHDQHLPTLLEHARGVVLINSTVGLSALSHGTPLKVCGNAIYDMPGLTYQGPLDDFWPQAEDLTVDAELYLRFRNYLIERTQLNGSFYQRLDITGSSAGLVWAVAGGGPDGAEMVGKEVLQHALL
ncbi:capsular biosynthesis protein [Actimicrobium sp. CCI2.3]|uniref:capsule biosynthesis protein n=1 Tax=Actimicrobium sp. CCI2.3 TaxID=3048616 RepID=UPI002AB4A50D|nr:capsular biosynthesis protein [Actimicrobium sp. CCI2.3]MDY7573980.1 capsular biosynthesis protein [Actimicrobium sp. CCI2.3]MEB0021912.1 capsular biosynthesis protein [Actimicrobium sp. CCI2.3]